MLDPKNLKNGQCQWEKYFSTNHKDYLIQYDYRHTNGELFSTIRKTVRECEIVRNRWVALKEQQQRVSLEDMLSELNKIAGNPSIYSIEDIQKVTASYKPVDVFVENILRGNPKIVIENLVLDTIKDVEYHIEDNELANKRNATEQEME